MNITDFVPTNETWNSSLITTTEGIPVHTVYDDVLVGLNYLDMLLLPTCLILGVSGNFITLLVMNTKYFANWTSRYFLIALAISDNLLLLTQPLNKSIVMKLFGRDLRALSNLGCRLYFWFFKNGKMTSSWFVVLLCLERFVAVKFPFKVKTVFCVRNNIIAIVAVYIIIGVYNGVWSWAHNILADGKCYPDGINESDPTEVALFRNMLIGGCSLYSFLPICIMVVVTPMIISSMVKHTKKRQKMSTKGSKKNKELVRISTMLLSIVITYIIFVLPVTILHVSSAFLGIKSFGNNSKQFQIYLNISQMLEQLNYTINFFLYVVSNRRFRETVVKLFEGLSCCPDEQNELQCAPSSSDSKNTIKTQNDSISSISKQDQSPATSLKKTGD